MSASTVSARVRKALIDAGVRPRKVSSRFLPARDGYQTVVLVHRRADLERSVAALKAAFPDRESGVSVGGYAYVYTHVLDP